MKPRQPSDAQIHLDTEEAIDNSFAPLQGKRNFDCRGNAVRRGGRKPGPPRCVVQLRQRVNGKVHSLYSITIDLPPNQAMKLIQEAFHEHETRVKRKGSFPC